MGTCSGDLELLTDMVKASVCLHNFLMLDTAHCPVNYGDSATGELVRAGNWRESVVQTDTLSLCPNNRSAPAAMAIRNQIADHFMSLEGSLPWQLTVVRRS